MRIRFFSAVAAAATLLVPLVLTGPPATASPDVVADGAAQTDGVVFASLQVGDRTIIGGTFTTAGGLPRSNVAAVLPDGSVDPTWDPSVNGTVYALEAADDGSKIFLGGGFTTVGGVSRGRLAAVDPVDGALLTSWKAATNSNLVRALAAEAGRLYVGGSFSRIAGTDINRLAAVDQTTGRIDPAFAPRPNNTIRALNTSPDGSKVYAGGPFTAIAGSARPGIAELNAGTGSTTAFAPADGGVIIALDVVPDGHRVFFSSTSNRTYAYDPAVSNAAVYRVRTGGDVQAIEATDDEVYIGGHFTNLPEFKLPRPTLASFDPATGVPTAWNPSTSGYHYAVWTITAGPDFLAVGGDFTRVGGVRHQGFARFAGTP